jgi:hypothetical protein
VYTSRPQTLGLIGGARAWLELDREHDVLSWGEELRGSLVLEGGPQRHWITRPVRAELSYMHEGFRRVVGRVQLTSLSLVVHPRTTERLPLTIRIPGGVPFQQRLELKVFIHSGLWSHQLLVSMRAAPPPGYIALARQLIELTGTTVRYWFLAEDEVIIAHLKAATPEAWFAAGRLELSPPRAPWRGALVVSREPRWPLDRHEVRIALPSLAEEPDRLRGLLEEVLRANGLRPRSAQSLPVPAEQPALSSTELPIPTHEELATPLD